MKLLRSFIYTLAVIFLAYLSSCTEVPPVLKSTPIDTTGGTQQKNVLIENFTGVKCVNCPKADSLIDKLISQNAGRVESIDFHSGFLATPFPFSKDTFETAESQAVENLLGPCDYYPEGAVDRKLFTTGQPHLVLDRSLWAGLVAQELLDTDRVNISISNSYNSATRNLSVTVNVKYLVTVAEAQKISVMITESGIVNAQEYPLGVDTFYVHNRVFRKALTGALGDVLTGNTEAGSQLTRTYSYTLPAKWKSQNCRVIAFICDDTPDKKDVLQVAGANVQ